MRVEDTRKGFEESFASGDFYNRQTQDAEHLERILAFINVRDGMRILDLGCGSGYLTFPIAERNPYCEVTGLDIVSDAIEVNRSRAKLWHQVRNTWILYWNSCQSLMRLLTGG